MNIQRVCRQLMYCLAVSFSLCGVASHGFANDLPFQLPDALTINNAPLPPYCFLNFVGEQGQEKPVNLKNDPCLKHRQAYNQYALKQGLLGYDLKTDEPSMRQPSIFYRYIGEMGINNEQQYVFLVNWSGGGSGFFSNLMRLRLKDHKLSLAEDIDAGDRCMGGIAKARIEEGQLVYWKKITPQMLLDVFVHDDDKTSASLQDCAVCCLGTLIIKGTKVDQFAFSGTIPFAAEQDTHQQCFNRLIISYGAKDKKTISANQIRDLQKAFRKACV